MVTVKDSLLWRVIVKNLETALPLMVEWLETHEGHLIDAHLHSFVLDISASDAHNLLEKTWVVDIVPECNFHENFLRFAGNL